MLQENILKGMDAEKSTPRQSLSVEDHLVDTIENW